MKRSYRTVGLFAGIGGIESGLARHGHPTTMLAEKDLSAKSVLSARFTDALIEDDVQFLDQLPECDLVSAGFPCQNLSQCGDTSGIAGKDSSLVNEVFRLVASTKRTPRWVLLENVPFMLRLDRGNAMTLITNTLRELGYKWAYRTVDARAFGVPQRRLRVIILASTDLDPCEVLFADNANETACTENASAYGFYWTEGLTGLGWGSDCVPTLKGGSTIGIPSPPAVWVPSTRQLGTIDIRDAERLQGFTADWTQTPITMEAKGIRWKLIGNAVCVKISSWIGKRLASPGRMNCEFGEPLGPFDRWPSAAYGDEQGNFEIIASTWPVVSPQVSLLDFLKYPLTPLSKRATSGFLNRAKKSRLKFASTFLEDVANHLSMYDEDTMSGSVQNPSKAARRRSSLKKYNAT